MRMYVEVPRRNERAVEIFNALKRNGEIALNDLIAAARGKYGEDLFIVYREDVGFALKVSYQTFIYHILNYWARSIEAARTLSSTFFCFFINFLS